MTSASKIEHYSPTLYLDTPKGRNLERMIHYHQDVLDIFTEISALMEDNDAALERTAKLCLIHLMTDDKAQHTKQKLFSAVDKLADLKATLSSAIDSTSDSSASDINSNSCSSIAAVAANTDAAMADDGPIASISPCGEIGNALHRYFVRFIEETAASMSEQDAFADIALALVSSSLTLSEYYALHLKVAEQDSSAFADFPCTLLPTDTALKLNSIMAESCAAQRLKTSDAAIIAEAIATQAEGLASLTAALLDEKDESYRELLSVSVIASPTAAKTLMLEQDEHVKKLTALVLYSLSYAGTAKLYKQEAPLSFYACLANFIIEQMRIQACNAVQSLSHEDTASLMLKSYLLTIMGAIETAQPQERDSVIASVIAYPTITLTTGMLFNLNNAGLTREQKRDKSNRFHTYRPSLQETLRSWLRGLFK